MKNLIAIMVVTMVFAASASTVSAEGRSYQQNAQQGEGGGQGGQRGGRRGPPQEAISACNGLAENDSCSFQIQVEGSCFSPPQGESLACRPANHKRGGGQGGGQGQGRGQRRGQGRGQDEGRGEEFGQLDDRPNEFDE